jgi:hypothetical protein
MSTGKTISEIGQAMEYPSATAVATSTMEPINISRQPCRVRGTIDSPYGCWEILSTLGGKVGV